MRLQSYLKEDPSSVYNKLEKARFKFAKKEQIFNLIISKYSETQITRALETRTETLPSDWCVQWLIWRESLATKPVLAYRWDKEIYKQFMREAFFK